MTDAQAQAAGTQAGQAAAGQDDIDRLIRASGRVIGCVAPDSEPGISVASWLNISRFAEAAGDENPLYTDVQYGAGSPHHTMLAPPTFVLAVRSPGSFAVADFMPHQLAGNLTSLRLTWNDTIRLGDALTGSVCVADVTRRYTPAGSARACVVSTVDYQRNGAHLASGLAETELAPLAEQTWFSQRRPLYRYGPAEIEQIERELAAEQPCRGGVPRYWSDVAVGQTTQVSVKGPLTLADLEVWVFAEGRPVRAGNLEYMRLASRDGRRETHPVTGWPVWDRADESLDSAVTDPAGPPAPAGLLVTLAGQHVTHWMGDDGFLRQLGARIQRPFRYGDTLRLTGTVADRDIRCDQEGNRYHAATLRVTGTNQLDQAVVVADGLVFLPDRGKPVRLPVRGGLSCDTPLER